jgi:hypothetical protein
MSAQPTLISTVRETAIKIQNADGTANKSLGVAAVAAGTRVKSLIITSDDTVARTLQLIKTLGGVDYILGEIVVPIGAGTDGATAAVDGLGSSLLKGLQTDGLTKWLDVANGTTINLRSKVAVTAGKTIYATAELGDFT